MRLRAATVLLLALSFVPSACAEKAAPPPAPAAAPKAPDPTPLDDLPALLAIEVKDAAGVAALAARAKALADHAASRTGDAGPATIEAARLDVFASAAAIALGGDDAAKALAPRGGTPAAVLREAVRGLEGQADPEAAAIREAALAVLATDPEVRDVKLHRASTMTLAAGTSALATAVRAAWLAKAAKALDAFREAPAGARTAEMVAEIGPLLGAGAAEAASLPPDRVSARLLADAGAGGVVCDAAKSDGDVATPAAATAALSNCPELAPEEGRGAATLLWSDNALVVAALRTAWALSSAAEGSGPLAGLSREATDRVRLSFEKVHALPLPAVAVTAPGGAVPEGPRDHLLAVPDLGSGGLAEVRSPLGVVHFGPDGVRAGLRALASVVAGKVVAVDLEKGLPASGRLALSWADLEAAAPEPESGSIPALSSAAREIAAAEDEVFPRVVPPAAVEPSAGRFLSVAVDLLAPAGAAGKALDALRAGGVSHFRFLDLSSRGLALPLLVREAPAELATIVPVHYERPLFAVVTGTHVDLWEPAGAGDPRPEGDRDAAVPEGPEPGYRGVDLVRLRIPIGEGPTGLDPAGLDRVAASLAFFLRRSGAGRVLHVVGGEGARAADVLRVADRFQNLEGTPLEKPDAVWPLTVCPPKSAGAEAPSCPTGVAIAFSKAAPPSDRGVRSTPAGNVPVVKAEAPPEAGFCRKEDIEVGMAKRKGDFRFCYQRELQLYNDLQGRVVLRFTIGADGAVKGEPAVTSSTLGNDNVHKCLAQNVKKITFAKPEGGHCVVSWPWTFQPK